MTYADVKDLKPTDFKRCCGVKPQTFVAMLEILQQHEQQKMKPGRAAALSLADQLLLTLQYWREYRTYFHLSLSWGVSEATVCRTVKRVEQALIKAQCFHLPGKKKLRTADHQFAVVVVDASEMPVERPQKNSGAVTAARKSGTRSKHSS